MIANPESQIFVDHLKDLDKIARPQGIGFDIGCYEYSVTTEVVEENIPQAFQFFQNYPNPINPSTKIRFTIPCSTEYYSVPQNVTLKVYDVLGNEVATLVDEFREANNYEVDFNPGSSIKDLVSGVYFYKLQAGTYVQSKKMILLK